jgi:hypothetical protein
MATQYTAGLTAGDTLTAAIMNSIGATPITYTPTFTQGATITKTVIDARYWRFNKMVIGIVNLSCTSNGTAGSPVQIGLPLTGNAASQIICGTFLFSGGPSHYGNKVGASLLYSTTTLGGFMQDGVSNWFGANPSFQLLTYDSVYATFMYEVA